MGPWVEDTENEGYVEEYGPRIPHIHTGFYEGDGTVLPVVAQQHYYANQFKFLTYKAKLITKTQNRGRILMRNAESLPGAKSNPMLKAGR